MSLHIVFYSQKVHSRLEKHADAVHPRAVGGPGVGAAVGALHRGPRLPHAHGGPHQGLADQHRAHQASLRTTRQIQTSRYISHIHC